MEYVLETSALTKHYRGFTALDSLTMRVPKGAIYGFVGRNGAGKTTLIRLICGLQEPTGGSFTLYGVRNTDARICRSRRRMGAVVETPSVYTDMTAEENLRQQSLVLGMPSTGGAGGHRKKEGEAFFAGYAPAAGDRRGAGGKSGSSGAGRAGQRP